MSQSFLSWLSHPTLETTAVDVVFFASSAIILSSNSTGPKVRPDSGRVQFKDISA